MNGAQFTAFSIFERNSPRAVNCSSAFTVTNFNYFGLGSPADSILAASCPRTSARPTPSYLYFSSTVEFLSKAGTGRAVFASGASEVPLIPPPPKTLLLLQVLKVP